MSNLELFHSSVRSTYAESIKLYVDPHCYAFGMEIFQEMLCLTVIYYDRSMPK